MRWFLLLPARGKYNHRGYPGLQRKLQHVAIDHRFIVSRAYFLHIYLYIKHELKIILNRRTSGSPHFSHFFHNSIYIQVLCS